LTCAYHALGESPWGFAAVGLAGRDGAEPTFVVPF